MFVQSFVNLLLKLGLYFRVDRHLVGGEAQKCGGRVKARQKEQQGLSCNVVVVQFCKKILQNFIVLSEIN